MRGLLFIVPPCRLFHDLRNFAKITGRVGYIRTKLNAKIKGAKIISQL